MRKFLANRMALAALAIVLMYVAVALSTGVFGAISREQTFERVGPKQVPGFFRVQKPEKRLEDAEYLLGRVEQATKRSDPEAALAEIQLGQLTLRPMPVDTVREEVDRAFAIYDDISSSVDLNEDPDALPRIVEIEQIVAGLFREPQGVSRVKRWFEMVLGTDAQGRSIALRSIYSIEVAIKIGVVVALFSVLIGGLLGTAAGFYGGWVDHLVTWLFTTFSSIPSLVLLVLLAYLFTGSRFEGTLIPMYIAFSATYWIGPCRVIRGETMKLRELEYVQAATALGFGRPYIMVRHILPNASHLMLINFSLLFIAAIKGEVILTYLGLGIKNGTSWGIMIEQSRPEVINGFFWQIGTATVLMFGLVLAFNVLSDALQDAFDPKHV
jgi:peptide/nickel transport system permease protein